jgi:hypothetical protein
VKKRAFSQKAKNTRSFNKLPAPRAVSRQALWLGLGAAAFLARLAGLGGFHGAGGRRLFLFPPGREPRRYLVYVAVLCLLLVAVCWLKGEPPRWRWGNDERS